MRIMKTALVLALIVAGVLFAVANQQEATVRFYSLFSATYPLYLILFACFLAGTVAAALLVFVRHGSPDREVQLERLVEKLQKDLEEAKGMTGTGSR